LVFPEDIRHTPRTSKHRWHIRRLCHDLDCSGGGAPIAYDFLKSLPNKNTATAINDWLVVCNPHIESGYLRVT
jgi:hypothetical protein